MNYFSQGIGFFQKHTSKSLLIIALDVIFYILFIPITILSLKIITTQISSMPFQVMGEMMQSLENMQDVQTILIKILLGLISGIILFFILILLNIAILKGLIWRITLKKKSNIKYLLRSILLTIILALIFLIPLTLASYPFLVLAKNNDPSELMSCVTNLQNFKFIHFIPLILLSFLVYYIFSLGFFFLAKENSFKKAFKNSFKQGFLNFPKLSMPFVGIIAVSAAFFALFRSFGSLVSFSGILLLAVIIVISFANRVYLSKIA